MQREVETVVEFREVSLSVGGVKILDGLSLSVGRGETLALLGESGSGKTTTLRLVNRLALPTAGAVLVEGRDTREWDPIALRRRTGYVIQEAGLFPHFTVEGNIGLVPTLEGWDEMRVRARAHELLELIGLDPERFAARYPAELSGGQRQRVGVAAAVDGRAFRRPRPAHACHLAARVSRAPEPSPKDDPACHA
jgi:osmoprotectant transport system ATP-binding protein